MQYFEIDFAMFEHDFAMAQRFGVAGISHGMDGRLQPVTRYVAAMHLASTNEVELHESCLHEFGWWRDVAVRQEVGTVERLFATNGGEDDSL